MEIRAYNELYLPDVMKNLAVMMHYGVNHHGIAARQFFSRFLTSGIASQIYSGNPLYLVGKSGAELADEVITLTGGRVVSRGDGTYSISSEYWAGWILAYYQWRSALSFSYISSHGLDIEKVLSMYAPLHEADPEKFVEIADSVIAKYKADAQSPLKVAREKMNMTQKQLSETSGISLRMIRAYEQKSQDISKATAASVMRLATVLCQKIEDLV